MKGSFVLAFLEESRFGRCKQCTSHHIEYWNLVQPPCTRWKGYDVDTLASTINNTNYWHKTSNNRSKKDHKPIESQENDIQLYFKPKETKRSTYFFQLKKTKDGKSFRLRYYNKKNSCQATQPGGYCPGVVPNGNGTCTWNYEEAGSWQSLLACRAFEKGLGLVMAFSKVNLIVRFDNAFGLWCS